MENKSVIFIDSNYWIYLLDAATMEHVYIKNHFKKIYDNYKLAINVVVLVEVMHYLVKRLGNQIAKDKWKLFTRIDFLCTDVVFEDLDYIFNELIKYSHTGIGGRDATIINSMKSLNITEICTHDKSFLKIPDIKVTDPVP